jgi:hypothetical protein
MSSRIAFALSLAAALAFVRPALAADPVTDGISAMPAGIEDVRIGGTWEKEGKTGAYRIVISRSGGDTVVARLFVQWISYTTGGDATVDTTIEIKEIAEKKIDIVDYTSESDQDGLSVYIETIDPSGNGDQNYELHITSPTDYKFGPTSN